MDCGIEVNDARSFCQARNLNFKNPLAPHLFVFLDVLKSLKSGLCLSSYQGLLQSFKGAGVQHFLLDLGGVWAPGHQEELLLLGHLCSSLQCPG